jgi:hypothetical protein
MGVGKLGASLGARIASLTMPPRTITHHRGARERHEPFEDPRGE